MHALSSAAAHLQLRPINEIIHADAIAEGVIHKCPVGAIQVAIGCVKHRPLQIVKQSEGKGDTRQDAMRVTVLHTVGKQRPGSIGHTCMPHTQQAAEEAVAPYLITLAANVPPYAVGCCISGVELGLSSAVVLCAFKASQDRTAHG